MAELIALPSYGDMTGSLTVLEKVIPFDMKRLYWMYHLDESCTRGKHRHIKTHQVLICLRGSVDIYVHDGLEEKNYRMRQKDIALWLKPEDWHSLSNFSEDVLIFSRRISPL